METLTLAFGKTTLKQSLYFATMLFKDRQWSITLPVDSAKDAHDTAKEYRQDGYQTMVVKIDNISKVVKVRDLLQQRYRNGKTVLKTIDYTADGIALARLETTKPIHLKLTTRSKY